MKTLKFSFLFLSIIVFSCREKSNPSNPIDSNIDFAHFAQNWVYSLEEQELNDPSKIYRPSDFKQFPALRYREQLKIMKDGKCSYLVLHPSDAHYFQNGTWDFVDRQKNILIILDPSGNVYLEFQVTELKKDLLKLIIVK